VVTVAILPLTYWRTNLHSLVVGDPVNVEADVLVKLAYSQIQEHQIQEQKKPAIDLTEAWLVANGY
jgi:riboflavin synthase